jgi:hypothetical protein
MRLGDIKRLEIVPVIFDLRTLGSGEAETSHDIFDLANRLRDRVQFANPVRLAGQRGIELGITLRTVGSDAQARLGRFERRFDRLFHRIQLLARLFFVGASDPGHVFGSKFQPAVFGAEELNASGVQLCRIARRIESLIGGRNDLIQFSDEFLDWHHGC